MVSGQASLKKLKADKLSDSLKNNRKELMKEVQILIIDGKYVVYESRKDARNDYHQFRRNHKVEWIESVTMITTQQ